MDQQPPNTDLAQHAAAEIMRRLRAKERELRETQATGTGARGARPQRQRRGASPRGVGREAVHRRHPLHDVKVDAGPRASLGFFLCLSQRPHLRRSTMRAPPSWTATRSISPSSPSSVTARCHGGAATWSARHRARGGFLSDRGGHKPGPARIWFSPPVPRTSACATRRMSSGALRERARRLSGSRVRTRTSPTCSPSLTDLPSRRRSSWTSSGTPTLARFHTHHRRR